MRILSLSIFCLLITLVAHADDKFPLRVKFPKVPTIETAELDKNYNNNIIVDVRSKFEYDTIHIVKAINVVSTTTAFLPSLEKVRGKNDGKLLILYCNGVKCAKSFEAAEKAIAAGFKNIKVYDAGVLSWGLAKPEKTFLMGKSPADPKKIISEANYKAKFVKFEKIKTTESNSNVVIYDVRDPLQRKTKLPLKGVRELPLDRITPLLKAGQFKDKTIYFIDAVGKQNEWLQYYLIEFGYTNYWFLDGGADGIK